MRLTSFLFCFGLALCGLSGCDVPEDGNNTATVDSDAVDTDNANGEVSPDNTGVNDRDADGDTLTPIDQGQSEADVKRTAEIRSQVLEIENLSINGQNVKIITNDGKVTLRGPVDSADERQAIERIAVKVAGAGNVTNQLEVAAENN